MHRKEIIVSSLNSQSDNTVDEHIIDEAKQSGISEKEAKNIIEEEEGIELLQHSGNLYESTDDKYKDNLSSAITFFVCGAAGIIILILNDIGILKFVTKGSSNFILVNVVLGLLFVGFIVNVLIVLYSQFQPSLKYSKKIKSNASIENEATDTIINWLNDNVTKEDIEGSYNNDIAEEMKYFNRSDYIKNAIMKQFPDTSEGLCDTISDKYIDSIFNM